MMKEKLDFDFLFENAEQIGKNISYFLGMFEKEDVLTIIDEERKDWIIDKSIIYFIAIKYNEYNVKTFEQCATSEEINNKQAYIIPIEFRNMTKDIMNSLILNHCQNEEVKIFEIDSINNKGRLKLLEDTVIYQIKLLHKEYIINKKKFDNLPTGLSLSSFESEIKFKLDTIINNSIKYILCYENSDYDKDMCKELFSKCYKGTDNFKYRLRKHAKENIQKYINNFLVTYLKKETDVNGMTFQESRNTLQRTLDKARYYIDEIYSHDIYFKDKQCALIHKDYIKLFENAQSKINRSTTFRALKTMIKKSKMNYIMIQNEGYIYPFIFDLLVMSFSLLLKTAIYQNELNNSKSMAKTINSFNNLNVDKNIDANYLHQEFLRLVELLPENFNDYNVIIIKHYSEILNVDYNNIASVFRQLKFPVPDHNKGAFKIPKYLKNKFLSIDEDHFRCLSLNII